MDRRPYFLGRDDGAAGGVHFFFYGEGEAWWAAELRGWWQVVGGGGWVEGGGEGGGVGGGGGGREGGGNVDGGGGRGFCRGCWINGCCVGYGSWLRRGGIAGGGMGLLVLVLVLVAAEVRALLAALLVAHGGGVVDVGGVVAGGVVVVVVLGGLQLRGDGLGASSHGLRSPTRDGAGRRGMALSVDEAHAGSRGGFGGTQRLDRLAAAGAVVLAVWGVKVRQVVVVLGSLVPVAAVSAVAM